MKKQLVVAIGLAVVAAPAFATKARLEALGEDNFGSYYINDNRNYFLNAARINNHKDLVTYEFGASGDQMGSGGPTGTAVTDAPDSPKAEGGFTKGHGNLVYGLHFGNTSPAVGAVRQLASAPEVQPWELIVGGDAGLKWGAALTYEDYSAGGQSTANRVRSNSTRVRGGVMMGDMEVFGNLSVANNAKNNLGGQVEGELGYLIGTSTMVENYRVFADFTKIGAEYTPLAAVPKGDFDLNRFRIGAGRADRLNDRATLFSKLMVVRASVEDDVGVSMSANSLGENGLGSTALGAAGDYTAYILPLTVGMEYAATTWLDLRASVSQNFWSMIEVDPKTGKKFDGKIADTAVRAGASLKFGEFSVDGLISTDADGAGVDSDDASTDGGNGSFRTDNLLTRVSMIYRF